jgi:hypothetical protein
VALTLGTQVKVSIGARWMTTTPITVDTSYPTGGWALTQAQLGLPLGLCDSTYADQAGVTAQGAVDINYDKANQKLMCFNGGSSTTAASEIANATNLSADLTNLQMVAIGR